MGAGNETLRAGNETLGAGNETLGVGNETIGARNENRKSVDCSLLNEKIIPGWKINGIKR